MWGRGRKREREKERERAEMVLIFILIIGRVILLSWRCGQSVLMSGTYVHSLKNFTFDLYRWPLTTRWQSSWCRCVRESRCVPSALSHAQVRHRPLQDHAHLSVVTATGRWAQIHVCKLSVSPVVINYWIAMSAFLLEHLLGTDYGLLIIWS